jgi:hypothetical protein
MQPTLSFWDNFSGEGRTKKLWSEALRETDPQKSLDLLRSVCKKLSESIASVHLWLPFLDTFLTEERMHSLNAADLAEVERMGWLLQQRSDLSKAPPALAIWQRLIGAYSVRGEHTQALSLAEKLYKDKTSDKKTCAYCLRVFALQRMIENRYIDMYIGSLQKDRQPERNLEIFQALDLFFTIDFSVSDTRLANIERVAQSLLALPIPTLSSLLPHIQLARGIYALLAKSAPEEAREYFEHVRQHNDGDRLSHLGLLACDLRLGSTREFTQLMQNTPAHKLLLDTEIRAVLNLHLLNQWLDQLEIAGPILMDASVIAQLTTFPLERYAGDIALATLGRSYLLLGNAQLAREQFDALLKKGLRLPQWGYYAAWAYALCGEGTRVVDCFERLARWPGRWTVACILLDLDQQLAERSGATSLLKKMATTEVPVAAVVRSRLALAQASVGARNDAWTEAAFSLEETLEALRTGLALTIVRNDQKAATSLIGRSSFVRLPLADQTFWLGLVEQDPTRSLALLEKAAKTWQYQRAAQFLLVRFLRQGSWSLADQYLEQALAGRTGSTAQLIRIYIEGRDTHIDDAIEQGKHLAAIGTEIVNYMLGNLYFYQARMTTNTQQIQQAYLQAALAWQKLQASGLTTLPADLPALAASASFIAYPQQRATSALTLIQNFRALDVALRQPWLEWHVALALLWYGTSQDLIGMYTTLLHLVEKIERADDATVIALAQALTSFAYKLKESMTAQQFLELQERFAQWGSRPDSKLVLASAIIVGQRMLYLEADEHLRMQIEESLRRQQAFMPHNRLLILWQVYIMLDNNKREETAKLLQNVLPDDTVLAYLAQHLLHLLNGTPLEDTAPSEDTLLTPLSRDALSVVQAVASGRVQDVCNHLLSQNTSKLLAILPPERILPLLCNYIQQKGMTVPDFLTDMFHSRARVVKDSAALVHLAWCASVLGNMEATCRLWEEALHTSTNDERHTTWRQDFVRFLCHQAVREYSAGQSLDAADKLRLAARWTMPDFGRQLSQKCLLEHARTLELRAITTHLLTYLFPDFDHTGTPSGRYHALGLTLAHSPQLSEALISRDRERIQQAWKKTFQEQCSQEQSINYRFLHTMSVLYREVALSKQAQRIDTEKDWITSTTLWILLLCTEAFWQHFTAGGEQSEQRKLSARQRDEVWQDALDNILVYHSTLARKSLAAGEHSQARIHARCLALGRQTAQRLLMQLEQADLTYSKKIAAERLAQIKTQTQKLLNEWGQSLLTEAEKNSNDGNSIAQLPRGIRKNYAGGIRVLEAFIRLDVPLIQVLLACLDKYNEWCNDLSFNGTRVQYRETAEAASLVCERLQRQCDKKNAYAAENRAIAQHLVYRGLTLVDVEPERAIHFYGEAIAWGSDNPNLDDLMSRTHLQRIKDIAQNYADKQQFEDAYTAIAQAEPLIKEQDAVKNLRMRICFRHARELVAQEKYTEALSRGKQALALEPANTILQRFISETEELLPEESYAQIIREAELALERQDFSQVQQLLARIPANSRQIKKVQDMRQQVLQQQQIPFADKARLAEAEAKAAEEEPLEREKLAKREEQLRDMLQSNESGRNRPKVREELANILARYAAYELKQFSIRDEPNPELRRSRLNYACGQAEEALEFDPRNTLAQQSLENLKKLLAPRKEEKKGGKA